MARRPSTKNSRCPYAVRLIALFILLFHAGSCFAADNVKIRVGVYNFAPLVSIDNGNTRGLFIDVLQHIAKQENWQIEYVPGTWNQCLDRLKAGKINLLCSIASSRERARHLDFSREYLFLDWGIVYRKRGGAIENIFDLEGKKIGVLKSSIYTSGLRKLLNQFAIQASLTEYNEYSQIFAAIDNGQVNAGINAQVSGLTSEGNYNIEKTHIFFSPVKIRFAVKKNTNRSVLATLDRRIKELKADKESIYYRSYDKLISGQNNGTHLPDWFFPLLWTITVLCVILIIFISILRRQVRSKTSHLAEANLQLIKKEQKASRKQAEFEAIFTSITDAIIFVDTHRRIIMVNPAFAILFGYRPKEVIGKTTRLLYADPENYSMQGETRYNQEADPQHSLYENEYRKKDGAIFTGETLGVQVTGRNGELIGFIGVIRDISARKEAEKQLRLEKERAQRYLDIAAVMLVALNSRGEITMINRQGCKILQVEEEATIGLNWFDRFLPETVVDEVKEVFNKIMRGDIEPVEFYENPVITGQGERRVISFHNSVLKDADNNISGILFSGEDITNRALLESQLRQAQKMESIGTLAGGIAHDFNNILAIMLGNTEIAVEEIENGNKPLAELGIIQKAALRARDLVRQILSFSRKTGQELRPVQPHLLVKEIAAMLRSSIPVTVDIETDIDPECGFIIVDPNQLHQVIMNLATNAVQAMREKGALRITLHKVFLGDEVLFSRPDMEPGNFVRLSINDTGPGIDRQIIDRIFDPFFTTKDIGKGTGLGLSVVHGIVTAHHGMITVDSKPGQGTTFNVYFAEAQGEEVELAENTTPLPTGTESILLVDDDPMVAAMGGRMLTQQGYEVTVKTDSVEALDLFRSEPEKFALVITDQTMPKMTGIELSAKLMEIRPDIPIIICTGYSSQIRKEDLPRTGIKSFFMKPFNKRNFTIAVRRVLDGEVANESHISTPGT